MHCIEALTEKVDVDATQNPQTTQQDVTSVPENSVHIINGNAVLQEMTRQPETFEGLAAFVFNTLPAAETVHFVTDAYLENSVKQLERCQRGSARHISLEEGKPGCREISSPFCTIPITNVS